MTDGFQVDGAALHAHAAQVDELAARMRTVAAAARPLDLTAYGLVGQVFALAASDAAQAGSAVVGGLAEQAAAMAHGVRATCAAYRDVEHQNIAGFGGAR
ncbi:type VII secretion target [Pseudonocardia sp.]|uniref:type VII secretion target n=1 Tax=Pseudonocardia sp. TaxID=60912 RepID=UPI0031FBF6B2